MATRRYFTLLVRDAATAPWQIAFGDYSRDVVAQESRDEYATNYRASNRKIIQTAPAQAAINAAVQRENVFAAMNASGHLVLVHVK